jgi:hypothetical protein
VAKEQCRSSVTVTFFRALRYQELTNRFPREKRLTVTRAHFYHGLLARLSHTGSQREAGEGRGYEARAAWRAEAYLDSTVSTASKRNEVDAALSRLAADSV